jgi:hypothetical protein
MMPNRGKTAPLPDSNGLARGAQLVDRDDIGIPCGCRRRQGSESETLAWRETIISIQNPARSDNLSVSLDRS